MKTVLQVFALFLVLVIILSVLGGTVRPRAEFYEDAPDAVLPSEQEGEDDMEQGVGPVPSPEEEEEEEMEGGDVPIPGEGEPEVPEPHSVTSEGEPETFVNSHYASAHF